jgi:hypothetical protein
MLDRNTRTLITLAAKGANLPTETIEAMLAVADDKGTSSQERPVLLTQAQKARQLGVSRFTVRKLTRAQRLHPIELLPGLLRYRADELVQ